MRVRRPGVLASKGTTEDALAVLMSEAGMEDQAFRVKKLKVNLDANVQPPDKDEYLGYSP